MDVSEITICSKGTNNALKDRSSRLGLRYPRLSSFFSMKDQSRK